MLYDLFKLIPGINLRGIDVSEYAINNSVSEIRNLIQVANAKKIPFPDNSFDVVISINTIHNLARDECGMALKEIQRVSKEGSFVTIDAYNNLEETTVEWCNEILEKSPLAIRMLKGALNADCDGQAGLQQFAGDATMLFYMTEEAQEGRDAFREKRKPDFKKFPKLP